MFLHFVCFYIKKCLFRLYPVQELPLATGSFSGTVFPDWTFFRNYLFRFDPFQELTFRLDLILFRNCLSRLDPFCVRFDSFQAWCLFVFFWDYVLQSFLLLFKKSMSEASSARHIFSPPGFHVHSLLVLFHFWKGKFLKRNHIIYDSSWKRKELVKKTQLFQWKKEKKAIQGNASNRTNEQTYSKLYEGTFETK